MEISFYFVVSISIIILVLTVKNNIVYNIRIEALDEMSKISNHQEWLSLMEKYKAGKNYYEMVFDPFMWTRKQMFPWLWD